MSLLMDALRRAEEAKRLATPESRPDFSVPVMPGELALDPLEGSNRVADSPLPPLDRHLDSIDADLAWSGAAPPPRHHSLPLSETAPAADATREAERSAARNVFAVKQEPRSRAVLWSFVALISVATLAMVGYFGWQLQSVGSSTLSAPAPPLVAAVPAPPSVRPLVPVAERPPLAAIPSEPPRSAPPARTASGAAPAERVARDVPRPLPAEAAPGWLRLANSRAKIDQTLVNAYDAVHANRLDEARSAYEQVLHRDPRNVDALLGLAAIATRQGHSERAQQWYLRALEANPADVSAQAALINLRGPSDSGHAESRLKTLLAGQPDAPGLHFALGNLYARQGRWSEAQQAYFQAYALEPENADYLYNIAVSLDHLRQSKLAAQYYRMALAAAETRRGAFDENAAGKRLLELQR